MAITEEILTGVSRWRYPRKILDSWECVSEQLALDLWAILVSPLDNCSII